MLQTDTAIHVEALSKVYRLGKKDEVYDNLARSFFEFIKNPLNNFRKHRSLYTFSDTELNENGDRDPSSNILWAVKDVSFQVKKGEVVGIIGKNGAGKSTLLKILCRITDPTRGRAIVRGKVSSLLEVGTGFHPELTGRENVFLNGTILGMKKKEVQEKFDAIVDFSGVEKFIDTPVKRFSSGMQVRLAFSVAAHLDPEVLIIDEVLAVGDADFQKKCLNKMENVGSLGRTVLFVSHNMGAITDLCSRALWIDGGRLIEDGPAVDVVSKYLAQNAEGEGFWERARTDEPQPEKSAWLRRACVRAGNGDRASGIVNYDEPATIEIEYEIKRPANLFRSYIMLRDAAGNLILSGLDSDGTGTAGQTRAPGIYTSTCVLPERTLRPGQYFVSIGIFGKPREVFEEELLDAMRFQIPESGYAFNANPRKGIITPFLKWQIHHH
jgi:lipopolysaccharide transport system ATP-binding protein